MRPYHGLGHAQLLSQGLPAQHFAAISAVKEVSHEGADCAGVGGGPEGKQ